MSTHAAHYSRVAIILHWLIAFLIIAQIVGGKYMNSLEFGDLKFQLFQTHKSFGITILILSVLRLIWRLLHKAPDLPVAMKFWERLAAKLTHWGFYILMIGTPLMGWALVSASPINIPTRLFKIVPWPNLPGIERSEALAQTFSNAHEKMVWGIVLLLILHVGAALKHHLIEKDDVLARMLPFLRRG